MEKIFVGDCIDRLKEMADESVNCIVTSPPYYGLRDYGIDNQIGLEETPEEYIERLTDVFRECKRVLKDDGTLWLNIGDSYCGTGNKGDYKDPKYAEGRNGQSIAKNRKVAGCKQKDMIGIPWMLAFALRADGWYLRQDIIWQKPNPMPESVKDRCVKSHEYIFLLSKKPRYHFDYEAIQEKALSNGKISPNGSSRIRFGGNKYGDNDDPHFATKSGKEWHPQHKNLQYKGQQNHSMHERRAEGKPDEEYMVRNKRDVWSVATQDVKEAHFATFPENLIEPCILAGCPVGGAVLDPFCGSGTTGIVSVRNQRDFIGIELNPEYAEMSERRIEKEKRQGIQVTFDMIGGDNNV